MVLQVIFIEGFLVGIVLLWGSRGQRGGFRSSLGRGSGRYSDDEGTFRRGGQSNSHENSMS
ncbi:hypothetical protein NC651_014740 [Populus alba x Populus x berolinensis]|nr:hypothetical protein NC651_014740 [Populus alba x Populus x berolinensis]